MNITIYTQKECIEPLQYMLTNFTEKPVGMVLSYNNGPLGNFAQIQINYNEWLFLKNQNYLTTFN